MEMTFELQFVRLSLMTRSRMKEDWSIFKVWVDGSRVICQQLIASTSPRPLMLYSFPSSLFTVSSLSALLGASRKSSTYTLTRVIFSLDCLIKMLGSPLSSTKPRLLKNAITFWFQSRPDCLQACSVGINGSCHGWNSGRSGPCTLVHSRDLSHLHSP